MSLLPHAPATHRNREPIWNTIVPYLSKTQTILEIASGTGEHIEFMAPRDPSISWLPSDGNVDMLWAIDERLQTIQNTLPALHIDVCSDQWHSLSYDVLFCANMIHISPFESAKELFAHAKPKQFLILYGPFMENGQHNSEGNIRFDASLRSRDPRWGIRDINDLKELGEKSGLTLINRHAMPANNQTLIWAPSR